MNVNDDILITIPARGGSQRLKRKAMRFAGGHPLIWYTLDYVCQLGLQERAVVVTDDDEIAAYTLNHGCGVGVVREPPVSSENECSIRAVYKAVQSRRSEKFGVAVHLDPSCPVRALNLIERCVGMIRPGVDAVASVLPARSRPEWCLRPNADSTFRLREGLDTSQNLETWHELCGCVFVFRRQLLSVEPIGVKDFFDGLAMAGVVHDGPWCDIDTEIDLAWFKFLLQNNHTIWG